MSSILVGFKDSDTRIFDIVRHAATGRVLIHIEPDEKQTSVGAASS